MVRGPHEAQAAAVGEDLGAVAAGEAVGEESGGGTMTTTRMMMRT